MKNIAITLLAVLAFGCQPDYGHLQPEYEQLLEVQEQVQTVAQQVRSNQQRAAQIKAELQETSRLLDSLENHN